MHYAEAMKKSVGVPIIAVGKITTPRFADNAIAAGRADLVSIGRGMTRDPEWAHKAAEGRAGTFFRCKFCKLCVYGRTGCPA